MNWLFRWAWEHGEGSDLFVGVYFQTFYENSYKLWGGSMEMDACGLGDGNWSIGGTFLLIHFLKHLG